MDPVSHVLWGMTIVRKSELLLPVALVSNMPDILGAVPVWTYMGLGLTKAFKQGGLKGLKQKYFNIKMPAFAMKFYYGSHNLFTWGLFTLLLFFYFPHYLILSLVYLSHLIVDIPTHGGDFGTRLFWPLSNWYLNFTNWTERKKTIAINFALLIGVNGIIWLIQKYFL